MNGELDELSEHLTVRSTTFVLETSHWTDVELGGTSLTREWDGRTEGRLEVNLTLLGMNESASLLLVSLDATYANDVVRELKRRCGQTLQVLVLASHTHYAPNLASEFQRLGHPPDGLVHAVVERIALFIQSEIAPDTVASAVFGRVPLGLAAQRRAKALTPCRAFPYVRRGVVMAPPKDWDVPVEGWFLLLNHADSATLIWSANCHPTDMPSDRLLSSAYPGRVRALVRSELGPDLTIHFALGPCADVRPPFMSRNPVRLGWRGVLRLASNGLRPVFCEPKWSQWERWSDGLGRALLEGIRNSRVCPIVPTRLTFGASSADLSSVLVGEHPLRRIELSWFTVNDQIGLVAINAELTVALERTLRSRSSLAPSVAIGTCANEVVGYFATEQECSEGGYESTGWLDYFGLKCRPGPNASEVLAGLLSEMRTS